MHPPRFRIRILLVIALVLLAGQYSTITPIRTSAAATATEFQVHLDPTAHQAFGLNYPGTYSFQLATPGAQAQYRYHTADSWTTLPKHTSQDGFNAVAAARFDVATSTVYLSVPFAAATDDIFLRVLDAGGTPVGLTYLGMPKYYDNRYAAITVSLDDLTSSNVPAFQTTHTLLRNAGVRHTIAVWTGKMDGPSWTTLKGWLAEGAEEAVPHTRAHSCTDPDYQFFGYVSEIRGSRDDVKANLGLASVPTFIEPCGFSSPQVRQEVLNAGYLAERSTGAGATGFASWGSDGAYQRIGPTLIATGNNYTLAQANQTFDAAYQSGGIYHLMSHPATEPWGPGSMLVQHAQYIAGHNDAWYAAFGDLYQYRYLQERGKVTVTPSGSPLSFTYRSTVLSDSPLAYWRLDDPSGTTVSDQQGRISGQYMGSPTLNQPGALVGDPNASAYFNGSAQYVNIPYAAGLNPTSFSVEAWVYPMGGSGSYRGILASRYFPRGWVLYASAGNQWEFWLNNGSGIKVLTGGTVTLNTWTHLVGTFDGTTARLYANGTLLQSATIVNYQPQTSLAQAIGQSEPGAGFWFPGNVDESALYAGALSASRVQSHYAAGRGTALSAASLGLANSSAGAARTAALASSASAARAANGPAISPEQALGLGWRALKAKARDKAKKTRGEAYIELTTANGRPIYTVEESPGQWVGIDVETGAEVPRRCPLAAFTRCRSSVGGSGTLRMLEQLAARNSPVSRGQGQVGSDERPFLVADIARIRFAGAHASSIAPLP